MHNNEPFQATQTTIGAIPLGTIRVEEKLVVLPVSDSTFIINAYFRGTKLQRVATFSLASGAISSPSMPAWLPSTPRPRSTSSHFFAGPWTRDERGVIRILTKSSCMSTINGKLGVCAYLPGQVLPHAVLNHLMECRGVVLFQGSCDSWRYCCDISWIYSFTLQERERGN